MTRSFHIEFQQDWSQFFRPCNWRTFRFAHVEFEDDISMGNWECTAVILGIGFRAVWHHTDTPMGADLERRLREFMDGDDTL